MRETRVQSLGQEDPLEKEMATHSSTLAWKISWTEEPGRLQSMGSQRVQQDWTTSLSLFAFMAFNCRNPTRFPTRNPSLEWSLLALAGIPRKSTTFKYTQSTSMTNPTPTLPLQVERISHRLPPTGEQYFSHSRRLYFPEWPEGRGKVRNVCEGHGPRTEAQ